MRFTWIAAVCAATALSGCATFQHYIPSKVSFTADGGGIAHVPTLRKFGTRYGATNSVQTPVYCNAATLAPCSTTSNPGTGSEGDPAWLAFGKLNSWGSQLGLFATNATNEVLGTGSTGIVGLETLSSAGIASYTGTITATHCAEWSSSGVLEDSGAACGSGSGSGTVTDGSGTTTANELLLSSTTAHAYTNAATLPAAAMPALTGDVTSTAGSTVTTVVKVNGASVPASANCVGTNSSSQFTSGCAEPIGNSGSQITTLPYTVTTSDCGSQLVVNDASAGALDVPEANGSFATCQFDVTNLGAGTVTITPTTSTINGSTTLAVAQNRQCTLNSDGTNWQVIGCTALISSSGSGQPQDIQDFTATGTNTWTKPSWASSDSTATTRVACVGGGGGGASGAVQASGTAALGGGAGGGGAFAAATFKTSALASTETVTVGAGGGGGAALTSTGSGNSGNNGSDSSFGSLLVAYGGAGGLPGSYGGGGGGIAGGATNHIGGSVCGGTGTTTSGNAAGCADGGAGGAGGSNTGNAGYTGGNSGFGGAGGGSGGGLASTPATTSGGNGGNANSATGGTGGSAATTGSVGVSVSGAYIGGSGGGGGGSATSGTAGSGGNGVNGSGGGGGGGAEVTSGAGGTGGNGLCRVVTTY